MWVLLKCSRCASVALIHARRVDECAVCASRWRQSGVDWLADPALWRSLAFLPVAVLLATPPSCRD